MADKTVRHVEELVEGIVRDGLPESVLRRALEAALSAIMEAEVAELAGAGYGERSDERMTRRNGYRERTYNTPLGSSVLSIPKLRQGSYLPSFLNAHQRSDDALVLAVAECFRRGVSTRSVEGIGHALGVESLSRSTVSRMVEELDPQVEAFRRRALPSCPYVFVDARYEHVREEHRVRKEALLIAIGVREDGHREVLGYRVAPVENEAYWGDFLRDLRHRGLDGVKLVISDAHEGLKKAIANSFPAALWQRCKVHYLRNLSGRIRRKKRPALLSLAKTIFSQDTADEARKQRKLVVDLLHEASQHEAAEFLEQSDDVLTHMQMPREHWVKLHSTNVLERLNRELKRRTRVVSIFPSRKSLERLVGALLLEEHEEWLVAERRYIAERSMRLLKRPEEELDEMVPGASALLGSASHPVARGPRGEQEEMATKEAA